jgi:hypothetical protein
MTKHPWNEFSGPHEPWPPPADEPHPRAYAIGYLTGRMIAYIRSLFGRKAQRPVRGTPSPHRWVWWFLGVTLALIFWQPLLLIALLLLGALTGHTH